MSRLGGSIFVHNAIEFDYCVQESLASLCAVCDDVVALDAQSTDGTLDVLREVAKSHANLRVVHGADWNCAPNYARLAILANLARSCLKTDWHFMLQADEVIHESSFTFIRRAIRNQEGLRSYFCRRYNLFGDLNHYIRFNQPQENKPCSDQVIRLATADAPAHGDAESLQVDPRTVSENYLDQIKIFHYGLARRDVNHIEKIINMQSWFHGEGGQPDQRVVEMKKQGVVFDWRTMKTREMLAEIPCEHPRFSKDWAAIRQAEKTIPV